LDFVNGAEKRTLLQVVPKRIRKDGAYIVRFADAATLVVDKGVVKEILALQVRADDKFVQDEYDGGNVPSRILEGYPLLGNMALDENALVEL
jgi:hypothetical protein